MENAAVGSFEQQPDMRDMPFGTSPMIGSPWPYLVRQQQHMSPVQQVRRAVMSRRCEPSQQSVQPAWTRRGSHNCIFRLKSPQGQAPDPPEFRGTNGQIQFRYLDA